MEYFENDPIRDLVHAIDHTEGVVYANRVGERHIEVGTRSRTFLLHVVENY